MEKIQPTPAIKIDLDEVNRQISEGK